MQLHQVAQHADDLDRATDFYSRLLDAGPLARFDPPGLVFFALGSTRLLLERGAPSALLYLRVDDVRRKVAELGDAGVEVHTRPHEIFPDQDGVFGPAGEAEWMAFVKDSDGNLLGLATRYPM